MTRRKKWTEEEEEEEALIREYSELAGTGALGRLRTRERKFQPIADRVNALHHLRDPLAFPFRWSWRDVSIKIQNMRHQYLGVKQKIQIPPPPPSSSVPSSGCDGGVSVGKSFDWASGEHHWPNFLRYKQVFGDIDLDSSFAAAKDRRSLEGGGEGGGDEEEEEEDDDDDGEVEGFIDGDEDDNDAGPGSADPPESGMRPGFGKGQEGKLGIVVARKVVELGEAVVRREERRRERERAGDAGERRKRERDCGTKMEIAMETAAITDRRCRWEEERDWWRRREERREEEEMEWRERVVAMQMEHEKQVMQMHADACQAQLQMVGIMVRLVCQFIGSAGGGGGDGGLGGLPHQVLHNLQQQQQQEQGSMGGDNGKSDTSSAGRYM